MKPEELKNICESTDELALLLLTEGIYPKLKDDAQRGHESSVLYSGDFCGYSRKVIDRALTVLEVEGYSVHNGGDIITISWT